jgi:hypothetical protein
MGSRTRLLLASCVSVGLVAIAAQRGWAATSTVTEIARANTGLGAGYHFPEEPLGHPDCIDYIIPGTNPVLGITQAELDANRALWESYHLSNYDYTFGRVSEGYLLGIARVSVRSGVVTSVNDVVTSAENMVTMDQLTFRARYFPFNGGTIDDLFDTLQSALDLRAYSVSAKFDPRFGFPSSGYVDFHPVIAGEEVSFTVRDLVIVPEPGGALLAMTALTFVVAIVRWRRGQTFPGLFRRHLYSE